MACTIRCLNKFLVGDTKCWIVIMYMRTSVPSCDVRLLVTVGVRYGSTVVAVKARPKATDCEVDSRRHRTLCVRI